MPTLRPQLSVPAPIVDLGYSQYQGSVDTSSNITSFLGIRYAAAPVGDLRFRAPQPPANITGLQDATRHPEQCFQAGSGVSAANPLRKRVKVDASEDCLFLKFVAGAASQYRGSDLIAQSNRGLVAVIIQYRLGLFGFLPGTEVKKHGALNAGLRAGLVLLQMVANDGKTGPQLFRGAISSSTYLGSQYAYDDPIPEAVNSMACLRATDVNTLQAANADLNKASFPHTFLFVPVVDGTFITQRPLLSLEQGKFNGKSLLAVTNTFEGTAFVDRNATIDATDYAFELFPKLTREQARRVGEVYEPLGTQLLQKSAIMGESIFICPPYAMLNSFPGNVFKAFAVPPGIHGTDVSFYFPSLPIDVPWVGRRVYNNTYFVDAFAQSFMAFVVSDTILPRWDRWDPAGRAEMLFNRTDAGLPDLSQVQDLIRAAETLPVRPL
ncbi:Alpha/Beta hydrolase protein [Mycena polygramma]|nr:Alpha/Beta hydrolase protein [Mycena polygramma]